MKAQIAVTGKRRSRDNRALPGQDNATLSTPSTSQEQWQFLKDPVVQWFTIAFLVGVFLLWWQTARLQKQLAESVAIEQASSYAHALREVSARIKTAGVELNAEQKKKSNALLTFSALLMKSGDKRTTMWERFYNLELPAGQGDNGETPDEFIREAWTTLVKNPTQGLSRLEEILGQPTLRYVTGWQEGAGKGIVEILVPLDGVMTSSQEFGKALFGFFAGLSVVGLCLMAIMLGKTRRETKASTLQVRTLASKCTEQEKTIHTYEQARHDRRPQEEEILHAIDILVEVTKGLQKTTSELASSATEMAAAVNETTATVEEVNQTAALSSQKAHQVSASAQKAAQISQAGQKATEDTITEMQRIRDQMQVIAESIVQLGEQSHAIRDIIDTVNDLAEQSNVLAVNTAIEAQKAGVHGSGFSIVAHEVRSLAQQSKDATGQVQAILNDIEKATAAAVQMTARGAKATEVGMKQSVEAGESIRSLAHSVHEAAQSATLIATSNQQQEVGMDQLVLAMRSIQEGSEQTVASAQQVEGCVQQLQELEQRLANLSEQLTGGKRDMPLSEAEPVAEAA